MAKTYLEQMISNFAIPVNDSLKAWMIERIRETGHEPDEIFEDTTVYEPFTCSICGKEITDEFSNNAEPVNSGRCCNACNRNVVIPARIKGMR